MTVVHKGEHVFDRIVSKNIQGVPLEITGRQYYVHSVTGSDTNAGTNPKKPLATLDAAVGKCTADHGDVIWVMPGHAETYSTTGTKVTFDVAGITVVCLGNGADRPTFSFGHTGATMVLSAAGVKFWNFLFLTTVDLVTTYMTISGADADIRGEVRDTTDKEVVDAFTVANTTARFKASILHYGYVGGDANARTFSLDGVQGADIDVVALGKATTAIVNFVGHACKNIRVKGIFLVTSTTNLSKNVVDTITGSTWEAQGFDIGAGYNFSGGSGAALASDDVSAVKVDTAAIKDVTDLLPNAGALTSLAQDSTVAKAASVLAATGIGTMFAVTKTITKTAIVAAGVDLTGVSSVGALEVVDIYQQNDGTAFDSTGHAEVVEIHSDNAKGSASFFTMAHALGVANGVISSRSATTWKGQVLETGKKLTVKATTEDVTSGGTCDYIIILRRLAAGATIAAA